MSTTHVIDHTSSVPVYRQLGDWMVQQISTGEWADGQQLPSEPALAASLGVSRGTLRKTIAVLVQRGVLEQVHGKGTFVARAVIDQPLASQLTSVSEEFIRSGTPFATAVLDLRLQAASPREARALEIDEGDALVFLARVRSVDGTPVVLNHSFLPARELSGLLDVDFRSERLYEVLEREHQIVIERAHRTISAITASPDVARTLDADLGSPVLYSEQTVTAREGRVVEFSRAWFRGDRFRLSSETIRREGEPAHAVTIPSDWTMGSDR